jgi:hypothetical protein
VFKSRSARLFLLCLTCATSLCVQLNDAKKLARDIFKELIETAVLANLLLLQS